MAGRRGDGDGSPKKRGNRWYWWVSLGYERLPDGTRQRRREVVSADTYEEARAKGEQLRADFNRTRINSRMTLAEITDAYFIVQMDRRTLAGTTLVGYRGVARHFLPVLGPIKITHLRRPDVERWLRAMYDRGYKRTTLANYRNALAAVLAWAQRAGV